MREDAFMTQELRRIVYERLPKWDPRYNNGYNFDGLAHLLGHEDLGKMLADYTVENANTVRLLAGPHGYAVYKMLLLREDNVVAMEASSKNHG